MAKPWGGAGAWAAEAEQAEAEAKAAGNNSNLPADSFPSLGETVSSNKTTKKKKAMTFSISEFTVGKYVGPGGKTREMNNSRGLSAEEMMMLPTGPRDRSNEEPEAVGGLGGGFSNYGGFRGGGGDRLGGDRGESRDRGFGGGFDRERDGGRGDRMGRDRERDEYPRDDGPSRADEAGSWGANKKALPAASTGGGGYQSSGGGDRMGRGGYDDDTRERGRLSDRDLPSRADEVDNWGSSKKFVPSGPGVGGGGGDSFDRRGPRGGGGGGFEDAPRRGGGGGFDDAPGGISRADEVDNWGAAKKFVPSSAPPPERRGGGGGFESTYRDAGSEADRWARREAPPAREDVVRPMERPRLVLQPRSVPVDAPLPPFLPVDRNGENERPHSSHSTRSDRSVSVAGDETAPDQPVPKPKPRSNPFGAARPREEVLAEKGQDWRKIDAELDIKRPSSSHSNRSSRPQTPEVGSGGEGVPRSRPRVNPFGDARPRDASAERVNREWRKPTADVVVVDSSIPEPEPEPETEQAEPALEEEDSTTTPEVVS